MNPAVVATAVGLSCLAGAGLGVLAGWLLARMAQRTQAEVLRACRTEPEPEMQSEPGS